MFLKQRVKQFTEIALAYLWRLRDVRAAGQLLFLAVVLLVSWSGVKAINTNYSLQKQIAALQQQNEVQALENNNLKLQNEYYNSDQYLELAARQNFGLAAPGEKEILVPTKIALSYTVATPKPPAPTVNAAPPLYQRNLEAWVNFFLHRQPNQIHTP